MELQIHVYLRMVDTSGNLMFHSQVKSGGTWIDIDGDGICFIWFHHKRYFLNSFEFLYF